MSLSVTELGDGLRVVTEPLRTARTASIVVVVEAGARDETDDLAGISHLTEHLVFRGAGGRSSRSFALATDAIGAVLDATTGAESTEFALTVSSEHLDAGLDLLVELLSTPTFRDEDVRTEREVVVEELLGSIDDPDDRVGQLFDALCFADHPLGREVGGTPDTVQRVTAHQVTDFFLTAYAPARVVVGASGAIEHDHLVARLDGALLGGRQSGARPTRRIPNALRATAITEEGSGEQAHLMIGGRGPSRFDDTRMAAWVLEAMLGSTAGPLFQEIREERGLAYSVGAGLSSYADSGSFYLHATTRADHVEEVLAAMHDVCDRYGAGAFDDDLLEASRGAVRGNLHRAAESPWSIADRLASSTLDRGAPISLAELDSAVLAVTRDAVVEQASRWLGSDRVQAVVAPEPIGR